MVVMRLNYTKHLDRAGKSVKYHAFRSRELLGETLGIWDRTSDHADVKKFIRSLDDPLTRDRCTRSGRLIQPAKLHRVMFSMRRSDWDYSGLTSWKPIVREALEQFERQTGMRLEWVAAEHMSATHPHVHIDIKSVYTAPDGTRHRLRITQDLRMKLKASVESILEREHARAVEEHRHEREMQRLTRDIIAGILRAGHAQDREPDYLAKRRKRKPDRDREGDERDR